MGSFPVLLPGSHLPTRDIGEMFSVPRMVNHLPRLASITSRTEPIEDPLDRIASEWDRDGNLCLLAKGSRQVQASSHVGVRDQHQFRTKRWLGTW